MGHLIASAFVAGLDYSYDGFGERVLTVTGPSGSQSTIVSVGDDFEYDLTNLRANKFFSVGGVRVASLATSYTARAATQVLRLQEGAHRTGADVVHIASIGAVREQALCTQARTL